MDGSHLSLSLSLSRSLLLSFQAVTLCFSVCLCAVSLLYLPVLAGCEAGRLCLRGLALRMWCALLHRHRVTALPVSRGLLKSLGKVALPLSVSARLRAIVHGADRATMSHCRPEHDCLYPKPGKKGFRFHLARLRRALASSPPDPPPAPLYACPSVCLRVCAPACLPAFSACPFAGLSLATARHICLLRA